jgi:hypothetical protein
MKSAIGESRDRGKTIPFSEKGNSTSTVAKAVTSHNDRGMKRELRFRGRQVDENIEQLLAAGWR